MHACGFPLSPLRHQHNTWCMYNRRQGQLHCRDAAKVPAAGVDDSNPWASAAFPLQLGSVRVPLPKQQQEADFIKASADIATGVWGLAGVVHTQSSS